MLGTSKRVKRMAATVAVVLLGMALLCFVACSQPSQESSGSSGQAASETASQVSEQATSPSSSISETSVSASSASTEVVVPNVVNLMHSDATAALESVNLKPGQVTRQNSDSIAKGRVVSQTPAGNATVEVGTKVDLVISDGKAVTVPDLIGMTQSDAKSTLASVGLTPVEGKTVESTDMKPGCVLAQSVSAGTVVNEGAKVKLTISAAPTTTTVPNVAGMKAGNAKSALKSAHLHCSIVKDHSDQVAKGRVIYQSIDPGTQVDRGTDVTICVSLGKKPVEKVVVPDVIGFTWSDAKSYLVDSGLKAAHQGDSKGTVVWQSVKAGKSVKRGTLVTLTVEDQDDSVIVPDVVGMSAMMAADTLDALDLDVEFDGAQHGTVVKQSPKAGKRVEEGTTVTIKIDSSEFKD